MISRLHLPHTVNLGLEIPIASQELDEVEIYLPVASSYPRTKLRY